jgi:hypothetical protein
LRTIKQANIEKCADRLKSQKQKIENDKIELTDDDINEPESVPSIDYTFDQTSNNDSSNLDPPQQPRPSIFNNTSILNNSYSKQSNDCHNNSLSHFSFIKPSSFYSYETTTVRRIWVQDTIEQTRILNSPDGRTLETKVVKRVKRKKKLKEKLIFENELVDSENEVSDEDQSENESVFTDTNNGGFINDDNECIVELNRTSSPRKQLKKVKNFNKMKFFGILINNDFEKYL